MKTTGENHLENNICNIIFTLKRTISSYLLFWYGLNLGLDNIKYTFMLLFVFLTVERLWEQSLWDIDKAGTIFSENSKLFNKVGTLPQTRAVSL